MPRPRLLPALVALGCFTTAITTIIINPPQYDVTGLLALAGISLLLTVVIDK